MLTEKSQQTNRTAKDQKLIFMEIAGKCRRASDTDSAAVEPPASHQDYIKNFVAENRSDLAKHVGDLLLLIAKITSYEKDVFALDEAGQPTSELNNATLERLGILVQLIEFETAKIKSNKLADIRQEAEADLAKAFVNETEKLRLPETSGLQRIKLIVLKAMAVWVLPLIGRDVRQSWIHYSIDKTLTEEQLFPKHQKVKKQLSDLAQLVQNPNLNAQILMQSFLDLVPNLSDYGLPLTFFAQMFTYAAAEESN